MALQTGSQPQGGQGSGAGGFGWGQTIGYILRLLGQGERPTTPSPPQTQQGAGATFQPSASSFSVGAGSSQSVPTLGGTALPVQLQPSSALDRLNALRRGE